MLASRCSGRHREATVSIDGTENGIGTCEGCANDMFVGYK